MLKAAFLFVIIFLFWRTIRRAFFWVLHYTDTQGYFPTFYWQEVDRIFTEDAKRDDW